MRTSRGPAIWPSNFERLVPQLAPVFEPINWPGKAAQILAKHDSIFKKADWEANASQVFCSGLDPIASTKYGGALTSTMKSYHATFDYSLKLGFGQSSFFLTSPSPQMSTPRKKKYVETEAPSKWHHVLRHVFKAAITRWKWGSNTGGFRVGSVEASCHKR